MRIFLDTEFTGLHQRTTLVSLGLVAENNQALYIEFNDFDRDQINDWLQENVLDNLFILKDKHLKDCSVEYGYADGYLDDQNQWNNGAIAYTEDSTAKYLISSWLQNFKEEIQILSDCSSYDWVLFCEIFNGALNLPEYISPYCHDINQDLAKHFKFSDRQAFDLTRENIAYKSPDHEADIWRDRFDIKNPKHNALWDAVVIKKMHEKLDKNEHI